jgi:DNA-binding NtrC family response regulator
MGERIVTTTQDWSERRRGPVRMLVQLVRQGTVEAELVIGPSRPQLMVGRRDGADILVKDERVSRIHGTLKLQDNAWVYQDAQSSNGTYLFFRNADGTEEMTRVTQQRPQLGDELGVGSDRLRLRFLAAPTVASPRHSTTVSSAGRRLEQQVAQAASDRRPLLLVGGSGTGKTHTARRVHQLSRRTGKFVDLNCAGLPDDATHLHARLLGVVPGAYTGAVKHTQGELFLADQGTLFLDEVESLPREAQGFLLDVMEGRGTFAQMGAEKSRAAPKFRLVAAAKQALGGPLLRKDLVFRLLEGTVLPLPTLQERADDVPGFMDQFADAYIVDEVPGGQAAFSDDAYAWAVRQRWQGELRHLRTVVVNAVRAALSSQEGPVVHVGLPALESAARNYVAGFGTLDPLLETGEFTLPPRVQPPPAAAAVHSTAKLTAEDIGKALAAHDGNIEHTARALGIARNTLKTKMRKFGLGKG